MGKPDLEIIAPRIARAEEVLTAEALAFVRDLVLEHGGALEQLLRERRETQALRNAGERLDFLAATRAVRESDWTVAALPQDLLARTVEITGPVERKMIINALNSGADVFMADFEDANAPSWTNLLTGQANLIDAVRGTIAHTDRATGKHYELAPERATLLVRPRGLHLPEKHLRIEGRPVPGALVDFGLYFFHNARALLERGTGPYFYLPKMESHREARWYNDVFELAQDRLDLPRGTIKATMLIETLPAVFEMDEMLYELRDHAAGLNCGRWDYIFSFIKTLREDAAAVLPDRGEVGMTQPCMRAYTQLLIRTCHRRGAFAMGGMAAQIPIKDDPAANEAALAKVRADKLREVKDGHDGTWVAHPGLVAVAREVFARHMSGPNQLHIKRDDVVVGQRELLTVPTGARTDAGLRHNVRVGIQYLEAWLRGQGCVPLYNLMEDAATAEISRTQIWQWLRHGVSTDDGRAVTPERVARTVGEELERVRAEIGAERFGRGKFDEARAVFTEVATAGACDGLGGAFTDFLTLPAYDRLVKATAS